MNRVLLTGATGFIGSRLLELLVAEKFNVTVLKRSFSDIGRIAHILNEIEYYDLDSTTLAKIFENKNYDVVIHLATHYEKTDNIESISQLLQTNVSFPTELLSYAVQNNVQAFINTGTFFESDCSVQPVNEYCEENPFNLYAKTKLMFEKALGLYSNEILSVTLKLFSPYGPKDNAKVIPYIINRGLKYDEINLGDGFQKLDFVYVDDVAEAYLAVLKSFDKLPRAHHVFNVGSGVPFSIREIVSIIEEISDMTLKVNWGEPPVYSIPIAYADLKNIEKYIGWAPKTSLVSGLGKTLEYYKRINKNENK